MNMLKFNIKLAFAMFFIGIIVTGVIAFRLVDGKKKVVDVHTITNGIDYVFLGSSRMGCSIIESPEFRNRVIWQSSQSHHFVLMRLLEMERLGQLCQVKGCFVEMNSPCLGSYARETVINGIVGALPLTWRYFESVTDIEKFDVLKRLFANPKQTFGIEESQPDDTMPFTQRSSVAQMRNVTECIDGHFGWLGESEEKWQSVKSATDVLLREIGNVCFRNAIKVYYIQVPVTGLYAQRMPSRARMFDEYIVAKAASLGFEIVTVPDCIDDVLFRDAHHLSKVGARYFTEYIYNANGLLKMQVVGVNH